MPAGRTWFHSRSALMRQSYDGKRLTVWITRNITDIKEAEAERRRLATRMQQAQKLESLGILAGGIAHDFNNLLVGILGFADLALQTLPPESPALGDVERIKNSARRATELTNQMLAYSGRATFHIRPISLSDMVRDTSMLLESSISKEARLHFELAENLPFVKGDVSQIRQIVMNLITNASESLGGEHGHVTIRTRLVDFAGAPGPRDHLDRPIGNGPWVLVEVEDTGCGIDASTLARIFDPFFTTKIDGRGLGLAAVLGIVTGHGGAISVSSHPGGGTRFSLYLPPMEDTELDEELEGNGTTRPLPAHGAILVVDDEDTVREIFERMLPVLGFEVVSAASGEEALATYRQRESAFRAVILDASMPGIGGGAHPRRAARPGAAPSHPALQRLPRRGRPRPLSDRRAGRLPAEALRQGRARARPRSPAGLSALHVPVEPVEHLGEAVEDARPRHVAVSLEGQQDEASRGSVPLEGVEEATALDGEGPRVGIPFAVDEEDGLVHLVGMAEGGELHVDLGRLPESASLPLEAEGREGAVVGPRSGDARGEEVRVGQEVGRHEGPVGMAAHAHPLRVHLARGLEGGDGRLGVR